MSAQGSRLTPTRHRYECGLETDNQEAGRDARLILYGGFVPEMQQSVRVWDRECSVLVR
jgi:hypothetical protein